MTLLRARDDESLVLGLPPPEVLAWWGMGSVVVIALAMRFGWLDRIASRARGRSSKG